MRIATTMKSFCIEKYKRDIPDDTAFNFIYMLNQGISIDALVESMLPEDRASARKAILKRLCRNKYLRNSELFCELAGVKRISLNKE